jgi:hypothetical protein
MLPDAGHVHRSAEARSPWTGDDYFLMLCPAPLLSSLCQFQFIHAKIWRMIAQALLLAQQNCWDCSLSA